MCISYHIYTLYDDTNEHEKNMEKPGEKIKRYRKQKIYKKKDIKIKIYNIIIYHNIIWTIQSQS
jgi:hypothetical protein